MKKNKLSQHNENTIKIALAGILNSGKSTLFNNLTKGNTMVGNFPGATVKEHKGAFKVEDKNFELIDLPGIYSLSPISEEQKITNKFIRKEVPNSSYDFVINIIDATNITQSLRFTLELLSITKKVVVFISKTDLAKKEGIEIDYNKISQMLGVGVKPIVSNDKKATNQIKQHLLSYYQKFNKQEDTKIEVTDFNSEEIYKKADEIHKKAIKKRKTGFSDKIDRVILNKYLSIPIFFLSMFLIFWFAISFGGLFIEVFDKTGEYLFINLPAVGLDIINSPLIINSIIAGIGKGLQTLATFIPVLFFLFMTMALLKAIGYMSRLATIADKFMRVIGLPGSAFIPLLLGFGCTVPAVYGARTLTSKRDKYLTIFMAPFMSCGARLPVYMLFCAYVFKENSALIVFALYIVGIFMAILTGLLLKKTLFKGQQKPFITVLPVYILPKITSVLKETGTQTKNFIKGAGKFVIVAVTLLATLESIDINFKAVNDKNNSVLADIGKNINVIFEPMGIDNALQANTSIQQKNNWEASVALFSGLFAKEAIIATLNSLYYSDDKPNLVAKNSIKPGHYIMNELEEGYECIDLNPWNAISESLENIPNEFIGILTFDLLGLNDLEDPEKALEDVNANFGNEISKRFNFHSAFAYLLFILMYFPCLVVVAAARNEMGGFFTFIMILYTTLLAWSIATLYYQIASATFNAIYVGIAASILILMYIALRVLSNKEIVINKLKD